MSRTLIRTRFLTIAREYMNLRPTFKGTSMGNKIYVGNLSYTMRDEHLQQHFTEFGSVASAKVMMDRETGRSKGFGFVEMGSHDEAQAAIRALHGRSVDGRALVVNEARPREERPAAGGFGGARRSGGGFGAGAGSYGSSRRGY